MVSPREGSFRAVARRGVRPALAGLSEMLDAHGEMKTIEHVMGRANARRHRPRSWPIGAVAQDGDRSARCGTKAIQHAAQLLLPPISLGRHAAEHDPLAGVVADLSDEDLERAYLVAAHRFHRPPVDGERDRPRFARRTRRWRCHGVALQRSADAHGPLADRLDFRASPSGKNSSSSERARRYGSKAPIFARVHSYFGVQRSGMTSAAGVDGPTRRHTAPAGTEAGCMNLQDAKQRRQPPPAHVLQRTLSPAPLAAPSVPAMLLRLRLNQMALQPGQGLLALRQRQPRRFAKN